MQLLSISVEQSDKKLQESMAICFGSCDHVKTMEDKNVRNQVIMFLGILWSDGGKSELLLIWNNASSWQKIIFLPRNKRGHWLPFKYPLQEPRGNG